MKARIFPKVADSWKRLEGKHQKENTNIQSLLIGPQEETTVEIKDLLTFFFNYYSCIEAKHEQNEQTVNYALSRNNNFLVNSDKQKHLEKGMYKLSSRPSEFCWAEEDIFHLACKWVHHFMIPSFSLKDQRMFYRVRLLELGHVDAGLLFKWEVW